MSYIYKMDDYRTNHVRTTNGKPQDSTWCNNKSTPWLVEAPAKDGDVVDGGDVDLTALTNNGRAYPLMVRQTLKYNELTD